MLLFIVLVVLFIALMIAAISKVYRVRIDLGQMFASEDRFYSEYKKTSGDAAIRERKEIAEKIAEKFPKKGRHERMFMAKAVQDSMREKARVQQGEILG